METFGQRLRKYRRQCTDPQRGGLLTQARLGELMGDALGHTGYSGAAVSDWERDKSKIHADDRHVLVALLAILHTCTSLNTLDEANALLTTGNYRALDETELAQVFPEQAAARVSKDEPPESQGAEATPSPTASPHTPLSPNRHKQRILLDKVEHFWVNGVLDKTVEQTLLLDIGQERIDTAVNRPWQDVIDTAVTNDESPTCPILATFSDTDRALLILGAPGAGKTITLITLARDLIALARTDDSQPIPVILNLASWAEKRLPLNQWIVEELTLKYQIPRTVGRHWLENDDLILLLDGLDEVKRSQLTPCIQAINQFRETHGLMGIVVCCRLDNYHPLDTKLRLSGAIVLQPLSASQIESYLTAVGISPEQTMDAVTQNETWHQMARSPLMLRVMSNTYEPETAVFTGADSNPGIRHQHLFDVYINQMFQRRGPLHFSAAQTKAWLAWLARKMSQHNQAQFLLEQIQPSWLPSRQLQRLFLLTSRMYDGLSLGLGIWLFWRLVRRALADFDMVWSRDVVNASVLTVNVTNFLLFLGLFLLLGLVAGFVDMVFYERRLTHDDAFVLTRQDQWRQTAVVALTVFGAALLFIGFYREPLIAISSSLIAAFGFALTSLYIHGHSYRTDIRTIEALSWSRAGAASGLLVGLLFTTLFELIEYQVVGPTPVLRSYISFSLLFFLLGGLRGKRLPTTSTPNQGIWLSATSAGAAAGLFGICMSVVTAFLWEPAFGVVAGILTAWVAAALYGAGSVLNHFRLRLWLWRLNRLPWHVSRFLDEAADHVILNKVGGGYMFIHRLLQEHFAAMPPTSPSADFSTEVQDNS